MLPARMLFSKFPKLRSPTTIIKRSFLSKSYYCNEAWIQRTNSPILSKINADELYTEIDQRYNKNGSITAVDVDLYANKVQDAIQFDEFLDVLHKLRLSPETSNMLKSTEHATIRYLLGINRSKELLEVLDDRLNYGIFLDYYTANLLMDKFYKKRDFVSGVRTAAQLMLQEETEHDLSNNLGLIHCWNYLLNPGEWPEAPKIEEPEDEVKVRVKFLRNPFDDQHFDLRDPNKIIGKILRDFTKRCRNDLEKSLYVLGCCLFEDEKCLKKVIQSIKILHSDVVNLIPNDNALRPLIESIKTMEADTQKLLEDNVIKSVQQMSQKDIDNQCKLYVQWENERKAALDEQLKRLQISKRLAHIEELASAIKAKEEKLWFFENEDKIEVTIEEGKLQEDESVETRSDRQVVEEEYIPPEVAKPYSK